MFELLVAMNGLRCLGGGRVEICGHELPWRDDAILREALLIARRGERSGGKSA